MLKKLSKYMKGLWGLAAISAAGMIVEAFCELALPSLANSIYQKVDTAASPESVRTAVILSGLGMLALALLGLFGGVVTMKTSANVSQRFAYRLRGDMYRKISHFSFKNIDQFSTASLTTRMTNDVTTLQNVVMMCLRILVRVPALAVVAACFAVSINPRMSAMLLILLPILIVVVACILKFGFPMFQKMQKKIDNVNRVVQENLIGMRVVKAYVREDREKDKFHDASDDLAAQGAKAAGLIVTVMPVMMLIMYSLTILIVWVGAHRVDGGSMQVGSMTAFITYAMMIVMSFLMLTMMSVMLPRASVAAGRIDEVLQTETSVKESETPKHLDTCKGVLAFDHVHFRYPHAEEDALSDLCFTAEPGKTTAIIGSTGCGKSTLVNLIPRLYDATEGSITLDGVELRDLPLEELRQQIGFVPQKGVLFSGTIASNLRFGNPDASDAEIEQAAEIAQAMEFIGEKPDRFDSDISQGGTNVSGGQKQRLTIARAIAKHPKVFVFDDSFSALDLKTDAALRKALGEQVQDSTMIIVAQRISTILHADQILVLEEGKIVGKGTHEELLRSCEVYQQIAKSQLSAAELGLEEDTQKGAVTDGE